MLHLAQAEPVEIALPGVAARIVIGGERAHRQARGSGQALVRSRGWLRQADHLIRRERLVGAGRRAGDRRHSAGEIVKDVVDVIPRIGQAIHAPGGRIPVTHHRIVRICYTGQLITSVIAQRRHASRRVGDSADAAGSIIGQICNQGIKIRYSAQAIRAVVAEGRCVIVAIDYRRQSAGTVEIEFRAVLERARVDAAAQDQRREVAGGGDEVWAARSEPQAAAARLLENDAAGHRPNPVEADERPARAEQAAAFIDDVHRAGLRRRHRRRQVIGGHAD